MNSNLLNWITKAKERDKNLKANGYRDYYAARIIKPCCVYIQDAGELGEAISMLMALSIGRYNLPILFHALSKQLWRPNERETERYLYVIENFLINLTDNVLFRNIIQVFPEWLINQSFVNWYISNYDNFISKGVPVYYWNILFEREWTIGEINLSRIQLSKWQWDIVYRTTKDVVLEKYYLVDSVWSKVVQEIGSALELPHHEYEEAAGKISPLLINEHLTENQLLVLTELLKPFRGFGAFIENSAHTEKTIRRLYGKLKKSIWKEDFLKRPLPEDVLLDVASESILNDIKGRWIEVHPANISTLRKHNML